MRKFLAAAALTASVATGLAMAPAAQAATAPASVEQATSSSGSWGKYFSKNGKAYTYGRTFKSNGKVYTNWRGVEKFGGKRGYVWFYYYKGGDWHRFVKSWDGKTSQTWSGSGIKKIYTYTCWGGKHSHCGGKHFIY